MISLLKLETKTSKIDLKQRSRILRDYFYDHVHCLICHYEKLALQHLSLLSSRLFGETSTKNVSRSITNINSHHMCTTYHKCAAEVTPLLKRLQYRGSIVLYGSVYSLLLIQQDTKFVNLISTPMNYWIHKGLTVSNIKQYFTLIMNILHIFHASSIQPSRKINISSRCGIWLTFGSD